MFELRLALFYLETLEVNFVGVEEVFLPCSTSVGINFSQSSSACRTLQYGVLGCGSFVRGRKRKKGDSIPFILSKRDYMPRLPDEVTW